MSDDFVGPDGLDTNRKVKPTCAITGKARPRRDLVPLDHVLPSLADRIRVDHPDLPPDALISRSEVSRYRTLYVEELLKAEHGELSELDRQVAESIAEHDTVTETSIATSTCEGQSASGFPITSRHSEAAGRSSSGSSARSLCGSHSTRRCRHKASSIPIRTSCSI